MKTNCSHLGLTTTFMQCMKTHDFEERRVQRFSLLYWAHYAPGILSRRATIFLKRSVTSGYLGTIALWQVRVVYQYHAGGAQPPLKTNIAQFSRGTVRILAIGGGTET